LRKILPMAVPEAHFAKSCGEALALATSRCCACDLVLESLLMAPMVFRFRFDRRPIGSINIHTLTMIAVSSCKSSSRRSGLAYQVIVLEVDATKE